MGYSLAWTFKIGTGATPTTLAAGRVRAFTADAAAGIAQMGSQRARLELHNDDGAYTPAEIGGNGTYKNADWFGRGLWIECSVDSRTAVPVFAGIISKTQVIDNGANSTFVIDAVDVLQVGGRVVMAATTDAYSVVGTQAAFDDLWGATKSFFDATASVQLPALGGGAHWASPTLIGDAHSQVILRGVNGRTAADLSANYLMHVGPYVAFPTTTVWDTDRYVTTLAVLDRDLARSDSTVPAFAEDAAGVELPVRRVVTGDDMDAIVNVAQCTTWKDLGAGYGTATNTSSNTGSISTYGRRTRSHTDAWVYQGVPTPNGDPEYVEQWCRWWLNRFNTPTYTVVRIDMHEAQLQRAAAGSRPYLETLLGIADCLWRDVTVTVTPTGGVETTTAVTVTRRTVGGQVGDVSLTLETMDGVKAGTIRLDDTDERSTLDRYRLG